MGAVADGGVGDVLVEDDAGGDAGFGDADDEAEVEEDDGEEEAELADDDGADAEEVPDAEPDLPLAADVEESMRGAPTSARADEASAGLAADTSDRSMSELAPRRF